MRTATTLDLFNLSTSNTFDSIDSLRLKVNATLPIKRKKELGQFMTSSNIADFMVSLFDESVPNPRLLDCGAGIGSLTIPAIHKLNPSHTEVWEIDKLLSIHLNENLKDLNCVVHTADFIEDATRNITQNTGSRFTHAILNPPYKKISSKSHHKTLLKDIGIESVNLYTAFLALTILLVENGGQIVAIVPRSFCNGLYYKPFRRMLLKYCSIDYIHIFESRTELFKDDDVLQENIIIKLTKNKPQSHTTISISNDNLFSDFKSFELPFNQILKDGDNECYIHIPSSVHDIDNSNQNLLQCCPSELGLQVSTGQVVDFRVKEYWLSNPTKDSIPLFYPHHFSSGTLNYPKPSKKPNALMRRGEISKLLLPKGFYVIVKRFSSKEENKRVVAYVITPDDINSDFVGLENHWNVFHYDKKGIDPLVARGIACFLNSTFIDSYVRGFSGHTQINATDLRNIKYPTLEKLKKLGCHYYNNINQQHIDKLIQEV